MNKLIINKNVIDSNNSTIAEVLALLYYYYNKELDVGINPAIEKGFISKRYFDGKTVKEGYFLTQKGIDFIENIILESDKDDSIEVDFNNLATKLRELYPEGKKPGTNYYWRDNNPTIVKKLKVFFKRYGNYSQEQIIDATKRYVESFNNNQNYMQLLKYFIWKNKADGSEDSELLNYLENTEIINLNSDWTTILK